MTADQMRKQEKDVLYEAHEAKREFEDVCVKARNLSRIFHQLMTWLHNEKQAAKFLYKETQEHHGFIVEPLPPQYEQAMNYQALLELGDEMRRAMRRMLTANEQKERLGL